VREQNQKGCLITVALRARAYSELASLATTMASNDNNRNKEEVEGRVEHTYLDHSNEIDTSFQNTSMSGGKATNAADRNFPVKLHYMLSELEADNQNHIVSWAPHGRCFVVHDQVGTLILLYFSGSMNRFAATVRISAQGATTMVSLTCCCRFFEKLNSMGDTGRVCSLDSSHVSRSPLESLARHCYKTRRRHSPMLYYRPFSCLL